ncbi:hypothetical protein [Desulfogranum japonicum]|uniref:hypothetical protein n=1 Tax=Desulfogranum japonicum TaxID=231447 RepID=UPI0004151CAE|nr:hypothetical protein [Desulfogranum japonicum]
MKGIPSNQQGQAAVESIFSVLIVLLLMLGSGQLLYVSLVSNEAVQGVHKKTLEHFQKMNKEGDKLKTGAEPINYTVEADPGEAYGLVVNNWSLFHRDYPPKSQPTSRYSGGGKKYVAIRGLYIATGPVKEIGRSAFGPERRPDSDGLGHNRSNKALRKIAFDQLCNDLGITNTYFR